jgi:hypothetical protein
MVVVLAVIWLIPIGGGATAYADTGNGAANSRNLPDGLLIMDEKGMAVPTDGNYFIDVPKIRPGEVVTKTLKIQNRSEGDPVALTISSQPGETSGIEDLLDKVSLELTLDGAVIYSGRLRGDSGPDMVKTPIGIGSYARGDERTLGIKLTASDSIKLGRQKSEAFFNWSFVAVRKPGDSGPGPGPGPGKGKVPGHPETNVRDGGKPGPGPWGKPGGPFGAPKTGDAFPYAALMISFVLSACGILLAAIKIRDIRRGIERTSR